MRDLFEVVVVLYNMTFSESPTIISLNQLLASGAFPEIRKILIFDNSEQGTETVELEGRFINYHSKKMLDWLRLIITLWTKAMMTQNG